MHKHFTQLRVWKSSHELVLETYRITSGFPDSEKFHLISQMRRASTSVSANIAEGAGRYHLKDKIRFFYHARGSTYELESFIRICSSLGYLQEPETNKILRRIQDVRMLTAGLINSVRSFNTNNSQQ